MTTSRMTMLACCLVATLTTWGQTDRRNVLQSDISGTYRNAVQESFTKELNQNYGLSRGYHGMLDFGYTFGVGDYDFGRWEVNTTHGYQFNPYFFLGGGLGLHFMSTYETPASAIALDYRSRYVDVPVFAAARVTFLEQNITPYVDGKIGYFVTHGGGLYANISLGCRFGIWARQAVFFTVGYTYENLRFETFDHYMPNNIDYIRCSRHLGTHGVSVKLGYEF